MRSPLRLSAQTQEVTYTNRLPVYVGDLIDEADATITAPNASRLCARLNGAINFGTTQIKDVTVKNNIVAILAANTFKIGDKVKVANVMNAAFLAGKSLTVLSATSTGFTAMFSNKDYSTAADSGTLTFKNSDHAAEHSANCIFHIVLFKDETDPSKVQTPAKDNWYVTSKDQPASLENLQQNKRLLGEAHVSFFFIFLNRAYGASVTNIGLASNRLTVTAKNSFKPNDVVYFSGVKTNAYLNGKSATVLSATPDSFTATFTSADVPAAADSGIASLLQLTPWPTPTSDSPRICDSPLTLPATGLDGYSPSYTIDVKRKISANVEHLLALVQAEGITNATEVAPYLSDDHEMQMKLLPSGIKNPGAGAAAPAYKLRCPDASFGGGTVDVAYRPADISITSALENGDGAVSSIDKTPFVVDNEGRYYWDFSVPVALKGLSTIQYQSSNNSFSPVNTTSLNAFLAVDGYLPSVDVKTQNWTKWPHPLVGVAFAKQPLSKILLAGAWGPSFSEVYLGAAWIKQPRIAQGSKDCSATMGTATTTPNSFGNHYCLQFSIGINLSVTGVASKLGSPK